MNFEKQQSDKEITSGMTKEEVKIWYETNEEENWHYLTSITSGSIFTEIVQGEKYKLDAHATGKTGTYDIELKQRFIEYNKYSTALIEADKVSDFFFSCSIKKRYPLYICFYRDFNDKQVKHMAIWRMLEFDEEPRKEEVIINSKVHGKVLEDRYYLPLKNAYIFKIENNHPILINKPNNR